MSENNKFNDIDSLLNGVLFNSIQSSNTNPLSDLFQQKIDNLKITKNQASKILEIDHKTLTALFSGDSKKIDFVTILKLSQFLEVNYNEIVEKHFTIVSHVHNEDLLKSKKRSFIVNNFNLPALKKIGFIDSINDFEHIENKILTFFGYDDIFEYSKYKITAVFSSAKRTSNKENLTFWIASAYENIKKTHNPNEYNRKALTDYFATIRWHSMNIETGLILVAQALFKMGITLIYVPKLYSDLHVRGATLSYNGKPCIALTKYTNFYPTMWFALIHELYHVLFDWDKIKENDYHISGETDNINISEEEANTFARQYLFSDEKMELVKPYIDNPNFVKSFAEQNHIHPSFIYVFSAFDSSGNQKRYAKFDKFLPKFDTLLNNLCALEWEGFTPIKEIAKKRNSVNFNII
jgi:HTH-type transcriptional regulator / antitoxin HigA